MNVKPVPAVLRRRRAQVMAAVATWHDQQAQEGVQNPDYFESWAQRWRNAADAMARHGGDVEAAAVEHALELAVLMSFFLEDHRQEIAEQVMKHVFSNIAPLHGTYNKMRASMAEAGMLDLSDEN